MNDEQPPRDESKDPPDYRAALPQFRTALKDYGPEELPPQGKEP